jgi:uncharacterized RmlC-like cupin family protein
VVTEAEMAETMELRGVPEDWNVPTYDRWARAQGVPILGGLAVRSLREVPVAWWEAKGAYGCLIRLEGSKPFTDAYVIEIPPGQATRPQRHLYDELVFIVEGIGATEVWNSLGFRQRFEWKAGSLFAIPLNVFYRHYNGSGRQPARYVAVTLAPLMMNLFHNLDFIFNCPYEFTDRFAGDPEYFSGEGMWLAERVWSCGFISDVYRFDRLEVWRERGAGGRNVLLELGHSTMGAHISEFPVGTYKKAHRHGPGSHVIILSGEGYTLMWKEGQRPERIDWQPGSMLVPPDRWFHQHFNVGREPARYLALKAISRRYRFMHDTEKAWELSVKLGGDQIEYEDQEPWIHEMFVEECRKKGVELDPEFARLFQPGT